MFPINDTAISKKKPTVNNAIITINIIVFIGQSFFFADGNSIFYLYGLVPARYTVEEVAFHFNSFHQIFSFLSFMFLHGGLWHLVFNMWSLYIFGDNIEDRLGHSKYLIFYILCGILSGITHMFFNFYSNTPVIGASGAIAGVMGAYLILYPRAKITTLFFFIPFSIPAFVFLGLWFIVQFFNATSQVVGSIAWWAHIGGFVAGIVLLRFFSDVSFANFKKEIKISAGKQKQRDRNVVMTKSSIDDSNLYGILEITATEAFIGVEKKVNVPWGFYNRIYKVMVPAGIKEGEIIRLKGLGKAKTNGNGNAGDLLLKIKVVNLNKEDFL